MTRSPSLELARDLMTEHGPGCGAPELLDVGAAKAAGTDANEHARSGRLRQVGELGLPAGVEYDRAHRRIVGGARGRFVRAQAWAGNDTRRRVETPPSRLSPDFRARTNTASSCCRDEAGKNRS